MEFGDVEGSDAEAVRFDAGVRARERCGEDDRAAKGQRVGGVRLGGIDVDTAVFSERSGIEPGAVRENRIAAEAGNGGFQMKAASDGNDDDFVGVRSKNGRELADAFGVAALREADKKLSADAKDVAALKSAGKSDVFELSKFREHLRKRGGFTAAGLRAQRQDHRQFIENDSGIFDKHGIRKIGLGGKRNNAGAQVFEKLLIGMMLLPRCHEIDRLTIDEGEFTIDNGRTDGACDGSEHSEHESLHESRAK